MDYDVEDSLWGPPIVEQDDDDTTLHKQTLIDCEFWFDSRTDVIEEDSLNEEYCEQVWKRLSEKKRDSHDIEEDSCSPVLLLSVKTEEAEDHHSCSSLVGGSLQQDIVTVTEPFTIESLFDICDEGRHTPRSHSVAVKEESNALVYPLPVLVKKRQVNNCFIRNTKQKVGACEAGEITSDPTQCDSMMISISDLKNMKCNELKSIAKDLKMKRYCKLKKEDLIQQLILKLTDSSTNQKRMDP